MLLGLSTYIIQGYSKSCKVFFKILLYTHFETYTYENGFKLKEDLKHFTLTLDGSAMEVVVVLLSRIGGILNWRCSEKRRFAFCSIRKRNV